MCHKKNFQNAKYNHDYNYDRDSIFKLPNSPVRGLSFKDIFMVQKKNLTNLREY